MASKNIGTEQIKENVIFNWVKGTGRIYGAVQTIGGTVLVDGFWFGSVEATIEAARDWVSENRDDVERAVKTEKGMHVYSVGHFGHGFAAFVFVPGLGEDGEDAPALAFYGKTEGDAREKAEKYIREKGAV